MPNAVSPSANDTDEPLAAAARAALIGQQGSVVWLTGLSGAGKSTLAQALQNQLLNAGVLAVVLDGDELRTGLCKGLGFSEVERKENIRRAAEAALLIAKCGVVVIVALISPYRADRELAAERCRQKGIHFAEVYVNAPLAECERRDPKHLYAAVREGKIPQFTGISSPYEPPLNPRLELHTDQESIAQSLEKLYALAISLAHPDRTTPRARPTNGFNAAAARPNGHPAPRAGLFASAYQAVYKATFGRLGFRRS